MYQGIDVHGDHGLVNWPQVKASGISFAFIKATEGLTFKDKRFAAYLAEATAAGVLVGPYHWGHPDTRPSEEGARSEAREFVKTIVASGWDKHKHARPVLDIEEIVGGDCSAWVLAFCDEVTKLTTVAPIVYSYTYWIRSHLKDPRLGAYHLWLANYGVNDGRRNPVGDGEGPWRNWTVHQYTSNGLVSGSVGRTDLNYTLSLTPLRASAPLAKPDSSDVGMWLWINWRRGTGQFKAAGPRSPWVRPNVPQRIPVRWWKRLYLNVYGRNP